MNPELVQKSNGSGSMQSASTSSGNGTFQGLHQYDMEEGIKSYNKKLYSEILDVINSVIPENGSNGGSSGSLGDLQAELVGGSSERQHSPEEIKGYH